MSFADSDKEAKWIWFDGNAWQSYDLESNHQIEDAFVNKKDSIELNNIHRVYFNYEGHHTQINVITKDIIYIKRTLHFKSRSFVTSDYNDSAPHLTHSHFVINNHQNRIKSKKKKRKKSPTKHKKPAPKASLLSNIQRIQLYKRLYSEGFNKQLIDKAIKKFNHKFNATSPILNDLGDIIQEITDILNHNEACDIMIVNNNNNSCEEEQGSLSSNNDHITDTEQAPAAPANNDFDFKIGAWIEVNINNNWIPGKIIDVNWSSRAPVTISLTIGYQDVFTKRAKQIKLNGSDINRNRVRPLLNNNNQNKEPPAVQIKKSRFNFDENDNWRRRDNRDNHHNNNNTTSSSNGTANGRFNRSNLSIHKFSFEYHKNNKKYDEKNAKHPSEYINRKCFKCKGSGKCQMKLKLNKLSNGNNNYACLRCKSTGFVQMTCAKCINGSGVYRKSHSLIHSKCNGHGCIRCNDSGKYPLHDILCNNCKGSGVYKSKCTSCCNNMDNNTDYVHHHSQKENQRYNQCMSGYRLPQLIPFVPKRENRKLSVHGANRSRSYERNGDRGAFILKGMHNMKRLYHATDKKGADGIIETGVMFRGGDKEGIIFTDSGKNIEMNAKQSGYLVIADVFIGKCKDEYYANNNDDNGDNNTTFAKLHEMGYDSVRRNLSDGNGSVQYIVYNWDQVWVHVVLPFEQVNFDLFG